MDFKTSPCAGCGKPIVWATSPDGKAIPLDPRPAIYTVYQDTEALYCLRQVMIERGRESLPGYLMVTHFATCPKASEFSGRNKK
jgi:hypothetical protein